VIVNKLKIKKFREQHAESGKERVKKCSPWCLSKIGADRYELADREVGRDY
jgi:3-methyladenine DNA glycosylase AlkD